MWCVQVSTRWRVWFRVGRVWIVVAAWVGFVVGVEWIARREVRRLVLSGGVVESAADRFEARSAGVRRARSCQ